MTLDAMTIDRVFQPAADRASDRLGWSNFAIAARCLEGTVLLRCAWLASWAIAGAGNSAFSTGSFVPLLAIAFGIDSVSDWARVRDTRRKLERALLVGQPVLNPLRSRLVPRLAPATLSALWFILLVSTGLAARMQTGEWLFVASLPLQAVGMYFAACQPKLPARRPARRAGAARAVRRVRQGA